jgi:hypothetical protein
MFGSWSLAIMPLDLDGMQLRELLIAVSTISVDILSIV